MWIAFSGGVATDTEAEAEAEAVGLAYPGPEKIATLPGRPTGLATFSLTREAGSVRLQLLYTELSWIVNSGQSSIWPERLVQVFTASLRKVSFHPIMKSPW